MAAQIRPLSPHLQIYRRQITSVLSIMHRATGVFLSFGMLLLCAFLFTLAIDAQSYDVVRAFSSSIIGLLLLIGWSYSLVYHALNGLRHLAWDAGYGLDLAQTKASGWTVVALSLVLTALIWFVALGGAL